MLRNNKCFDQKIHLCFPDIGLVGSVSPMLECETQKGDERVADPTLFEEKNISSYSPFLIR